MKHALVLLSAFCAGMLSARSAAETIWSESFETDGAGSRYTLSTTNAFSDGSADYFGRIPGDIAVSGGVSINGPEGSNWFGAQDTDGDGRPAEVEMLIANIDIGGYTALTFKGLFGEDDASDGFEDWDNRSDDNNFVHLDFRIDGGAWSNLLWFESSASPGAYNGAPALDTDFDGTGDGPVLTDTFAAFTNTIAGTGANLDVRITFNLEDGDEDIGLDDLRLEGLTGGSNPPILAPIGNKQAMISNSLSFAVTATPTEGDAVTLTADHLPAGASFSSTNENGTFTWPSPAPIGTYTCSFHAADDDGTDSETVEITVNGTAMAFTLMACNLSSQTGECDTAYAARGERIIQGLAPDVIGIQEWNTTGETRRAWVDRVLGTGFAFYVESEGGGCEMPNGVISRWPILDSGEWYDPEVSNRDFAWATIQIPAGKLLHVVSVHLKAGSLTEDRTRREAQARALTNRIATAFASTNFVALVGDLNLGSTSEACYTTLASLLSDSRRPEDQNGDRDTNIPRSERYDFVLPNALLNANHQTLTVDGETFTEGMVFDSRLWPDPPGSIATDDSAASGIQHLAVMKRFSYTFIEPPPVLAEIGNRRVTLSNSLSFAVTATPTDGDTVTLTVSNAPAGAWLAATNENGTFLWPAAAPVGVHTMTFHAIDNDGYDAETIEIEVVDVPPLFLSEIADPADEYRGRFVELFNAGTQAVDLAAGSWCLCKQTGDSGNWAYEWLTGTVAAGSTYLVAYGSTNFHYYYGFYPDQADSFVVSGNGDDVYALFMGGNQTDGALVDIFGVVDQDGTGQPWAYTDSRAMRSPSVVRPRSTWSSAEWTIVAANVAAMTPGEHGAGTAPILATLGDRYVMVSNLLQFAVTATPTEGDPVTLSAGPLPGTATFVSTNENGLFTWAVPEPVGVYTCVFHAADDDGTNSESIVIGVEPARPIVICEIMRNPSVVADAEGEWFEVYNRGESTVDLNGWTITDGAADHHAISNGGALNCAPGAFLVFCRNGDSSTNGGVVADYVYEQVYLGNAADALILLTASSAEVCRVAWDDGVTFPDPSGASMYLTDLDADPAVGTHWAASPSPWAGSAGDFGSPGSFGGDRDGDGMPDWWELAHFGGSTAAVQDVDADGDGMNNWEEYMAGTEPTNGLSVLAVDLSLESALENAFSISFPTHTPQVYRVDYTPDVNNAVWQALYTNLQGDGSVHILGATNALPRGFYRIGVRRP